MNHSSYVGRLVKEVEVKQLDNGLSVLNNTMAVQYYRKKENGEFETDFIPIVAWGSLAELIGSYSRKGHQIAIQGRMRSRNYNDKDGNRRYTLECVVEKVTFLSGNKVDKEKPKEKVAEESENYNKEKLTNAVNMELHEVEA